MPRRKVALELTMDRLRDLLSYNERTGKLTWRRDRGRNAKAGDEAGTVTKDGVVMIGLDGRIHTAARIAWALSHGAFPAKRVRFLNGDPQDLRYTNMVQEGSETYSMDGRARYQRRYRRETKQIDARLRSDTKLLEEYLNGDARTQRAIRKEIRDELNEERLRSYGRAGAPEDR